MAGHNLSPPQTFQDHIKELRRRFMWSVLAFMAGGIAGYIVHKQLIVFLNKPLHQALYYTSPAGSFNFVMRISMVTGVATALPVIIYNLASFIRPAYPKQLSKKTVRLITLLSVTLALVGALFAFLLVVPMSLHFFQSYSVDQLKPLIAADDYLGFIINCLVSFVIIFQTPLLVMFIDRIKPISPKKLLHYEKFVIVGSLVLALILPFTYDPLTQFLLAIPIVLLYNLSIIFVAIIHRKNQEKNRALKHKHNRQPIDTDSASQPALIRPNIIPVKPSSPLARTSPAKPMTKRAQSIDGLSRLAKKPSSNDHKD